MSELLRQVLGGWRELISDGKFPVLFLTVLLYAWYPQLRGKRLNGAGEVAWYDVWSPGPGGCLLRYAGLVLLLILLPPTGLLLRLYQTRFYDYVWVTAYLPMTAVIAYGAAGIYQDLCKKYCGGGLWKAAGLAALGLALILLCGNLSGRPETEGRNWRTSAENRKIAERLLDDLTQNGNTEDICLWAPADVCEFLRGMDGNIRLLYGRNMWEEALNAYSYDEYPEEVKAAYRWMEDCYLVLWGKSEALPPEEEMEAAVETALDAGVNCILLPETGLGRIGTFEKGSDGASSLETGDYEGELEALPGDGEKTAAWLIEQIVRLAQRRGLQVTKEQVLGYAVCHIGA